MPYRIDEASFDLPAGLHDQSVNVFTETPSGPSPFNIVVTRSRVPEGTTLADHVSREVDMLGKTLAGFEPLWRRAHEVDGRPAEIVGARISGNGPAMDQRQVHLLDGTHALAITASARDAFSPDQLARLNDFLGSFRFAR